MSVEHKRQKSAPRGLATHTARLKFRIHRQNDNAIITSLMFHPDGKFLALGSTEKTAALWSLQDGTGLYTLGKHDGEVWSVGLDPTGRLLASGSYGRTHIVKLWDIATGTLVQELAGQKGAIENVAFSPDGRVLASASVDRTIKLWDAATGVEIRTLTGHTTPVWSLAFSPDGRLLASTSHYGEARVWECATGKTLHAFSGGRYSAAFSPDGHTLVACGGNGVSIWDVTTGASRDGLEAENLRAVTFSPDGTYLAATGMDGEVRLWNVNTRDERILLPGHTGPMWAVVFSPDGGVVAGSGTDSTIRLWDVSSGRELASLIVVNELAWAVIEPGGRFDSSPGSVGAAYSVIGVDPTALELDRYRDPGLLAKLLGHSGASLRDVPVRDRDKDGLLPVVSAARTARWFGTLSKSGAEVGRRPELVVRTQPGHKVSCLAFSPDGTLLASGCNDMSIQIWDVTDAKELRTLRGHNDVVTSVAFSAEGRLLASGGKDGIVRIWDLATGGQRLEFCTGTAGESVSVTFAEDDHILVCVSGGSAIRYWHIATGLELHAYHISATARQWALSGDGRFLANILDGSITVWDLERGVEVSSTRSGRANAVAFSKDNRMLAVGGATDPRVVFIRTATSEKRKPTDPPAEYGIKLLNVEDGRELRVFRGHTDNVQSLAFCPKYRTLASGSLDGTVRLWDLQTGKQLWVGYTGTAAPTSLSISSDGELLASGHSMEPFWGQVAIWHLKTGHKLAVMERHIGDVNSVVFGPNQRSVATAGEDGVVSVWHLDRVQGPQHLQAHTGPSGSFDLGAHTDRIFSLAFTGVGGRLVSGGWDGIVRVWDLDTGGQQVALGRHQGRVHTVDVSSDGKILATAGEDAIIRLWDLDTGEPVGALGEGIKGSRDVISSKRPAGHSGEIFSLKFSPDSRVLASGSADESVKLWEFSTGNELFTLNGHAGLVYRVAFSPNGKILASGDFHDQAIRLWDVATGDLIRILEGHRRPGVIEKGVSMDFHPGGTLLASGGTDGRIVLWDLMSGNQLAVAEEHTGSISSVRFSNNGRLLACACNDASASLWEVSDPGTLRWVCKLYSFPDGSWVVLDAKGRFDASEGGDVPWLHWLVGLEAIALEQLKERYYEPGLLPKLLGFAAEPLRDVPLLTEVSLYPRIEVVESDPTGARTRLRFVNCGGGIGRIAVSINYKEVAADARGVGFDPSSERHELDIDLTDHQFLIPGKENVCEVRAYNRDGYLVSRDVKWTYVAPEERAEPPHFWAIIVGVSDYQGGNLDLRFAAKDAEDMAQALTLGSNRLLGPERVHVTLLTSHIASPSRSVGKGGSPERLRNAPDAALPTRTNIMSAFESVDAKSTDLLVLYLAGHGVNFGGQDGDYFFLTADALTGRLEDPAVRQQTAISSNELTDWLRRIPALKQVMILDTCAAGRFVDKLTEYRAIPSSQVRALDRMKDRTGLHILAGSTADAVSYESSRYGQGILTYSLLLGMRGAALREEEFIDVGRLFEFAADQVPMLVGHIGGIQRPVTATPKGGASFDIGKLSRGDREQIPLARVLPLVLRASFDDADEWYDRLGLSKRINDGLRGLSARGRESPLVFVDAGEGEIPDAYHVVGRYWLTGDELRVEARVRLGSRAVTTLTYSGNRSDLSGVAQHMVDELVKNLKRFAD